MACQEAFLFEFMGSINSNAFLGEQIHFTSLTKFVNPTANPAVTYVCKLGLTRISNTKIFTDAKNWIVPDYYEITINDKVT